LLEAHLPAAPGQKAEAERQQRGGRRCRAARRSFGSPSRFAGSSRKITAMIAAVSRIQATNQASRNGIPRT
jgi:hypothetical protein